MANIVRQTTKDKRIFSAVRDYYNERGGRVDLLALHLTGRKLIKDLTEEEKLDIERIKANMADSVYMNNLI